MNPKSDKLVRRTTMVATLTASYFLLTADYGPEPNVLDPINPKSDNLVRRTTMVAALAAYFLLTVNYGPEPNVRDHIKGAIKSAEHSVKEFIFGPDKGIEDKGIEGSEAGKPIPNSAEKHP